MSKNLNSYYSSTTPNHVVMFLLPPYYVNKSTTNKLVNLFKPFFAIIHIYAVPQYR